MKLNVSVSSVGTSVPFDIMLYLPPSFTSCLYLSESTPLAGSSEAKFLFLYPATVLLALALAALTAGLSGSLRAAALYAALSTALRSSVRYSKLGSFCVGLPDDLNAGVRIEPIVPEDGLLFLSAIDNCLPNEGLVSFSILLATMSSMFEALIL